MDAVTVPQEGSPPVPTHVYRCTYGSDYPSGCPCRRHNHAAPAPPAPRMAMEVAEVCVTSCPTDAMQCGRYVQSSPGVPQYAQAQGGAFTISKVKATEGGHLTPYWLLDKTSSHWDLDGYVSVDAIARARNWSQKSLPIRLSGASLATRLSGARGHTDEDSVLGNYLTALSPRWTTVAAIRHAGEPDYQLEDINSLRKKECNQLQYGLNGGRNPGTLESPQPTVAEDPHAASPATFAASLATPAVPPAMLAWLGLGLFRVRVRVRALRCSHVLAATQAAAGVRRGEAAPQREREGAGQAGLGPWP